MADGDFSLDDVRNAPHVERQKPPQQTYFVDTARRMDDAELENTIGQIKLDIQNVANQLADYSDGTLPEHFDDEWRKRATRAQRFLSMRLQVAKNEKTRRCLARQKGDITAMGPLPSKVAAFNRAAKIKLGRDVFKEIWDLAAQLFPEAFEETKDESRQD